MLGRLETLGEQTGMHLDSTAWGVLRQPYWSGLADVLTSTDRFKSSVRDCRGESDPVRRCENDGWRDLNFSQPPDESTCSLMRVLSGILVPWEHEAHSSEDRNCPADGARRSSEQAGETPSVSSPGCEATLQPASSARRQRRSTGPISVCLQRTAASTARSDLFECIPAIAGETDRM